MTGVQPLHLDERRSVGGILAARGRLCSALPARDARARLRLIGSCCARGHLKSNSPSSRSRWRRASRSGIYPYGLLPVSRLRRWFLCSLDPTAVITSLIERIVLKLLDIQLVSGVEPRCIRPSPSRDRFKFEPWIVGGALDGT
jgi:hypothetical protein